MKLNKKNAAIGLLVAASLGLTAIEGIDALAKGEWRLGEKDYDSLNDAVKQAKDDTYKITLNKDVKESSATTIENKKIEIDGNGHTVTWDKNAYEKDHALIETKGSADITLSNIIFDGKKAISDKDDQGSLIWLNGGKLTLGNKAEIKDIKTTASGAAVKIAVGSFTMKDDATITGCESIRGGAIYTTGKSGEVNITMKDDSSIKECKSYESKEQTTASIDREGCGGAIGIYAEGSSNDVKLEISDHATISDCTADNWGGAITVDGTNTKTTISDNVKFTNNTAETGGAIYIPKGTMTIEGDVVFTGNEAKKTEDRKVGEHSTNNGGAIYMAGQEQDAHSKVTIGGNTKITKNKAEGHGAGVALTRNGELNLKENVIIYDNEDSKDKGNIYVYENEGTPKLNISIKKDEESNMKVGIKGDQDEEKEFCSNVLHGKFADQPMKNGMELDQTLVDDYTVLKKHIFNDTDEELFPKIEKDEIMEGLYSEVKYVWAKSTPMQDLTPADKITDENEKTDPDVIIPDKNEETGSGEITPDNNEDTKPEEIHPTPSNPTIPEDIDVIVPSITNEPEVMEPTTTDVEETITEETSEPTTSIVDQKSFDTIPLTSDGGFHKDLVIFIGSLIACIAGFFIARKVEA